MRKGGADYELTMIWSQHLLSLVRSRRRRRWSVIGNNCSLMPHHWETSSPHRIQPDRDLHTWKKEQNKWAKINFDKL